jgi:hypothetical protein
MSGRPDPNPTAARQGPGQAPGAMKSSQPPTAAPALRWPGQSALPPAPPIRWTSQRTAAQPRLPSPPPPPTTAPRVRAVPPPQPQSRLQAAKAPGRPGLSGADPAVLQEMNPFNRIWSGTGTASLGLGATAGITVGVIAGLNAWNPIGWGLGAGLLVAGGTGYYFGGRKSYSQLPTVTVPTPVGGRLRLAQGTCLYHGTRWQEGEDEWWRRSGATPGRRDDEDGGVSFTLDPGSTPKVRNANVIIRYRLTRDVDAKHCSSKAQFHSELQSNGELACYAKAEQEVKIRTASLPGLVAFVDDFEGQSRSILPY